MNSLHNDIHRQERARRPHVRKEAAPTMTPLRLLVFTLAGFETLVGLAYMAIFNFPSPSDPLGKAISTGVTAIVAVLLVVFVLPALVLAFRNDRLKLALGLTLAAIPVAAVAFILA